MEETNLLLISVFAFVAVFLVLATLALIMRVLTLLFPVPPEPEGDDTGIDSGLVTAISAAAARAFPGLRVTRIEETR
jgi:hypothetical protein